MSRPQIVKNLKQQNPELSQKESEEILNLFSEFIEKALIENKNIELRGFGTLFIRKVNAKFSARNPKTGQLIYVPKKNKVRFKASKKLKELINR